MQWLSALWGAGGGAAVVAAATPVAKKLLAKVAREAVHDLAVEVAKDTTPTPSTTKPSGPAPV